MAYDTNDQPEAHHQASSSKRFWLGAELTVLYFGLPTAMMLWPWEPRLRPIPVLLVASLVVLVILVRSDRFENRKLFNPGGVVKRAKHMGGVFLVGAAVLTGALWLTDPEAMFNFPRQRPYIWMIVMVLYPLLSVYPQEILYRSFLFHRYEPLLGDGLAMTGVSAVAFAYAHIFFKNHPAFWLSLIGGWLFAQTYRKSDSLLAAVVEHGLYGCLIWTIGWGQYFYHGRVQ